jgi:hypothetical protein
MSPLATASSTVEVTLWDGVMARYGRGRIRLWIPWAFCETDQAANARCDRAPQLLEHQQRTSPVGLSPFGRKRTSVAQV